MGVNPEDIESAQADERERWVYRSSLHWFHWLAVGASLVVTLGVWWMTAAQEEARFAARFDREANHVLELVTERMQKYEDALWGGLGMAKSQSYGLDYGEWQAFARALQIDVKYPGINGIGLIRRVAREDLEGFEAGQRQERPDFAVYPEHEQPDLLPITFIEPEGPNAQAVGLDVAHEQNRYAAAKRARDTGTAQITGPIVLVQDAGQTPGFLFYVPWFEGLDPRQPATVEERQRRFRGLIYAPFVVKQLMAGTLAQEKRSVGIRIADGHDALYDELRIGVADFDPDPLYARRVEVPFYGRRWTFDVGASQSFRALAVPVQSRIVLVVGLTLDGLLLLLFVLLGRANRQAVDFAHRFRADLADERDRLQLMSEELQTSNKELERFVYVASHDLKAPLRAIHSLAEWIAEDLEDCVGLDPDTAENLQLLRSRVQRMESLLESLLQYSRAARKSYPRERVDARRVSEALELAGVPDAFRLEVDWQAAPFKTPRAPLELALRNLVANAVKHHDEPSGQIWVRAVDQPGYVEVEVEDDGPGIPREFRDRVFDMFTTLKARDDVEGSGMGLALVKRVVERQGGWLVLTASPVGGALFRFGWPREGGLPVLAPAPSPMTVPARSAA